MESEDSVASVDYMLFKNRVEGGMWEIAFYFHFYKFV